ncbi:response regulator transcription factor [Schleiferia thermophila]|jgi:CheY-like chemotaxis protein|uniref:Response regulator receiver domain-containing protein n=1 Tax=Schleiferia thermophila TaxID=884107 RepID=A0A368ZZA8_9FLAO|nr:response regulator [Schleiferia thermophila]KFD38423.1 chemotaxis protein CheY [Schleiferia thermophila str. Yellowstone]PMB35305.1 response regulator [Fischerella thermalis CCMEE 5319]RCX02263.1 response regulator receiver domain-containing protein [Schleiferia thermophila]GCD80852.1 hypothetical protein JCM30197_20990 [Schleiferia thermophila]
MTDEDIKVLVVDDEPAIIMSLDFLIRKAGYELFIARNGQEALDIINHQKPHIVVLDIMMPDIDGFEVCHLIKSNPETIGIKVIFLSAKSRREDIDRGLALGADFYLTKPFSNKLIMEKIRQLADELLRQNLDSTQSIN